MNNWSNNPAWLVATIISIFAVCCWVQLPGKDAQLIVAASRNNTNAIQTLVMKGADVNARAKGKGTTPLMTAADRGKG